MKRTTGLCLTLSLGASLIFAGVAQAKTMEVVLRLKEKIPVALLAASVLDPSSSRHNVFYSPEEIRDLCGPSDADYAALKAQLNTEGFDVVSESPARLTLTVKADSSVLERVFSTHLANDFDSRHGEVAVRRLSPYLVPSRLDLVASVSGLDTTRRSFSHLLMATTNRDESVALSPGQVRTAFGFDAIEKAGITGKNQHIAIATYDDFNLSDVQSYYAKIGMKTAPKVDKVVFNGAPILNNDSAAETETDAELSGMIAPGADIHVFSSSHNDDAGEVQVFTAILDDNRAKIVNYSWGDCEAHLTPQHKTDMDGIFARAVAQGVSIFVASGDSGAKGCRTSVVNPDFPGAHPDVVAVGGTTFGTKNGHLAETAWSGSGGGISTYYDLPSWQSGFQAPYVKRSFPDVAFNADPNTGENVWIHYPSAEAQWVQIGGTSIAAPQWSGFLALVNEARGTKGPLGFLNPVIYGFTAAQRASTFDDVTKGDNGYPAGPGWDAVTGWGGMHADALLNELK